MTCVECVTWWVMCGAVSARMHHIMEDGKEAARAFPVKRNNRRRAAHLPPVPSPISEPPSPPSSFSSSRFRSPPPRLRYSSSLASHSRHGTQNQQRQGSGQGRRGGRNHRRVSRRCGGRSSLTSLRRSMRSTSGTTSSPYGGARQGGDDGASGHAHHPH